MQLTAPRPSGAAVGKPHCAGEPQQWENHSRPSMALSEPSSNSIKRHGAQATLWVTLHPAGTSALLTVQHRGHKVLLHLVRPVMQAALERQGPCKGGRDDHGGQGQLVQRHFGGKVGEGAAVEGAVQGLVPHLRGQAGGVWGQVGRMG